MTVDRLRSAIAVMARHLHPGGVLIVELIEKITDLGATANTSIPREALAAALPTGLYFPPTFTTICARPLFRRRLSALRPPAVFMRARNPCLLTRFRFRGLYVGFITASPSHVYNVSKGA